MGLTVAASTVENKATACPKQVAFFIEQCTFDNSDEAPQELLLIVS